MEIHLGYHIDGEYHFIDNEPEPSTIASHSMVKEIIKCGLISLGIVAILIFTDGLAAPILVA
jgi:hypothetical protein